MSYDVLAELIDVPSRTRLAESAEDEAELNREQHYAQLVELVDNLDHYLQ